MSADGRNSMPAPTPLPAFMSASSGRASDPNQPADQKSSANRAAQPLSAAAICLPLPTALPAAGTGSAFDQAKQAQGGAVRQKLERLSDEEMYQLQLGSLGALTSLARPTDEELQQQLPTATAMRPMQLTVGRRDGVLPRPGAERPSGERGRRPRGVEAHVFI